MSEIVFGTVVFCDDSECKNNFYGKCMSDTLDLSELKCMTRLGFSDYGDESVVSVGKDGQQHA
jgi:hypothetical protein